MNMKEFKGTEGPWKTTEISLKNSIYIESKDECIGTVWRSEVSDANAKLIAAAPELLKELNYISNCCKVNAKNSKGVNKQTYLELAEIAEAAINKALD